MKETGGKINGGRGEAGVSFGLESNKHPLRSVPSLSPQNEREIPN
jgi:hypothetical protein